MELGDEVAALSGSDSRWLSVQYSTLGRVPPALCFSIHEMASIVSRPLVTITRTSIGGLSQSCTDVTSLETSSGRTDFVVQCLHCTATRTRCTPLSGSLVTRYAAMSRPRSGAVVRIAHSTFS